jgi:hypothetical protein
VPIAKTAAFIRSRPAADGSSAAPDSAVALADGLAVAAGCAEVDGLAGVLLASAVGADGAGSCDGAAVATGAGLIAASCIIDTCGVVITGIDCSGAIIACSRIAFIIAGGFAKASDARRGSAEKTRPSPTLNVKSTSFDDTLPASNTRRPAARSVTLTTAPAASAWPSSSSRPSVGRLSMRSAARPCPSTSVNANCAGPSTKRSVATSACQSAPIGASFTGLTVKSSVLAVVARSSPPLSRPPSSSTRKVKPP